MASSLPSPGQLVLENILLLSPTPNYFQERYGHTLTCTTFVKPGNTPEANAVLHFLLCHIDPEQIEPLFKPCFPIRDREQERDFRRVVDSRLTVLEKSKLLPVGVARKSVVSSAGGDRFLDLLWSLSSIALQQVCLRQPPYGPASRIQVTSQNFRSDSLSQNAPNRSNWSLLSAVSSRPERHNQSETLSHKPGRRFLSVGSSSASLQRARDAELIRARIDAERNALERTTDLAKRGANTWAKEADSLREKIGHFEAKLARLKSQLADMGFDENGNDIRKKSDDEDSLVRLPKDLGSAKTLHPVDIGFSTSPSQEELGEGLKTSPFDSAESGSSVDEVPDPNDGGPDLVSDFSRIISFAAETSELRHRVDRSFHVDKPESSDSKGLTTISNDRATEATDIVNLVRAATNELEQATNRMDQITQNGKRANDSMSTLPSPATSPLPTESSKQQASVGKDNIALPTEAAVPVFKDIDDSAQISDTANSDKKSTSRAPDASEQESKSCTGDNTPPFQEGIDLSACENSRGKDDTCVSGNSSGRIAPKPAELQISAEKSLKRHKGIIDACKQLQRGSDNLNSQAQKATKSLGSNAKLERHAQRRSSESMDGELLADTIARKVAGGSQISVDGDISDTVSEGCKDLKTASRALRGRGIADRKSKADILPSRRRREYATRSLDSISLPSPKVLDLSPRYDTDVQCDVQTLDQTSKRSVRFAELPPSYSRSRGGPVGIAASSQERFVRQATEVHPRSTQGVRPSSRVANDGISSKASEGKPKLEKRGASVKCGDVSDPKRVDPRSATDNSRTIGSSGQKPPRLERGPTQHRLVRGKETPSRPSSSSRCTDSRSKRQSLTNMSARSSMLDIGRISEASNKARGLVNVGEDLDSFAKHASEEVHMSPSIGVRSSSSSMSMPELSNVVGNPILDVTQFCNTSVTEPLSPSKMVLESERCNDSEKESAAPPESTVCSTNISVTESTASLVLDETSQDKICAAEHSKAEDAKDTTRRECAIDDAERGKYDTVSEKGSEKGSGLRSVGKAFRKNGLLRLSGVSIRGSIGSPKGRSLSMSSRESQESRGSTLNMSVDNSDLVSPRSNGQNGQHRGSNGRTGFFAGETAQWQQNVRLQCSSDGISVTDISKRGFVDGKGRDSRVDIRGGVRASVITGSSHGSSRKNRVHNFRARLAALSKD